MSDDIFDDIQDQLKKLNDKLAEIGSDIVSAFKQVSPSKQQAKKDEKEQPSLFQSLLKKVGDLGGKYGQKNIVSDLANAVAKHSGTVADLYNNAGTDGHSLIGEVGKKAVNNRLGNLGKSAIKAGSTAGGEVAAVSGGTDAASAGAAGAAGALEGVEAAGVAAGIGLGEVTAGISIVVAALAAMTVAAYKMAEQWIEGAKQLKDYNGQIGVVFAHAQVRDINRKITAGQSTGTSTAGLVNAMEDLKDSLAPIANLLTNGMNLFLTGIIKFFTQIVRQLHLTEIAQLLGFLVEKLTKLLALLGVLDANGNDVVLINAFIEDRFKGLPGRDPRVTLFNRALGV